MCQPITIIASDTVFRSVGVCRHGHVHLRWETITVHLERAEIERLAAAMAEASQGMPAPTLGSGDRFKLCIGPVTLELPAIDFYPLLTLLRAGCRRLSTDSAGPGRRLTDRVEPPERQDRNASAN